MTNLYTVQLGAANGVDGASKLLFHSDPVKVTVLRDLLWMCLAGTGEVFTVAMSWGPGTYANLIREVVDAGYTRHLELRQVIPKGTDVMVYPPAGNQSFTIVATGYLFG